jgi:hypothetical protein
MKNRKVWQGTFVACALLGGLAGLRNLDAFRQTVGHHFHQPAGDRSRHRQLSARHSAGHRHAQPQRRPPSQRTQDGYESTPLKIDRTWSWWVVGDIFGCFIIFSPLCIAHDIEGGYYTFDDKIYVTPY